MNTTNTRRALRAVGLCAALMGCGGKGAETVFTVGLNAGISTLDPGRAWNFLDNQITSQICETLITFDEEGRLIPCLATSWEQPDPLTYVYNLRHNVTFSNGRPLTMDDVLFSLERSRDPSGGTYFPDFFSEVASIDGRGSRLTITLNRPSAVFKYTLATGAGAIISKAGFDKNGTSEGSVIGTGPYVFKSWMRNIDTAVSVEEITLEKNPGYWGGEPEVDRIIYRVIPGDSPRALALEAGSIDFSMFISVYQWDAFSNASSLLRYIPPNRIEVLAMNTRRPPMSDINVRKAISHALDLRRFLRDFLKDKGLPGTILPFSPSQYGDNAAKWEAYLASRPGYDYNIELAREYMAASPWPEGFDCDLVIGTEVLAGVEAAFVRDSLADIGINVNIKRLPIAEADLYQEGRIRTTAGYRVYDLTLGAWEPDYPDVSSNLEGLFHSGMVMEGYNYADYMNPRADSLIEAQRNELDPEKRFELQRDFADIVTADTPYIPLYYQSRIYGLNKKWTGFTPGLQWVWSLPFKNLHEVPQRPWWLSWFYE